VAKERSDEPGGPRIWLFDLDDTLHDASNASMQALREAMGDYIERHLGLETPQAHALRQRYWHRYGATLLGLVRHHGVDGHHFLHETHRLPGLETRVRGHGHDLRALRRLRGRKVLLTNAPQAYVERVLGVLGLARVFERVVTVEDMRMFGHWRPKPDVRMLRAVCAALGVSPARCVLVEDAPENLRGARRAGMGTVWMRRWHGGRRSAGLAAADRTVTSLRQLL
jgi:putative hydrolase of the HAD superfamily